MSKPIPGVHLNPERHNNNCGGCGRPVPAVCPYCQTCHCSLNCSVVTAGNTSKKNWANADKHEWIGILAIALCILLTLVVVTLIISVWYYSDRWAGTKGSNNTEESNNNSNNNNQEGTKENKVTAVESEPKTKNEDFEYNDYQYAR